MKIKVDNKYTYACKFNAKIGQKVILPTPSWLRDVKGPTWTGKVTSLTSDYTGYCEQVIGAVD
jgi:hypothetical protein